jgi:putative ABC transport system permease protein
MAAFGAQVAQDFRYSLRLLKRSPSTTLVATGTLAVGIGAAVAIFSLVEGVLLRPLPYPQPERIVRVGRVSAAQPIDPDTTAAKYAFWSAHQQSLGALSANAGPRIVTLEAAAPEQVTERAVTSGFFRVLEVAPAQGRLFVPEEGAPGAAPTAVLGYGLWRRRFGGDPAVVGSAVRLDGRSFTVVGVAPEAIDRTLFADVFTLWHPDADPLGSGDNLQVLARLAPGADLAQAQANLRLAGERFRVEFPRAMAQDEAVEVVRYQDVTVADTRPALLMLMGAVALLLLIACANVANVIMARLVARRGEFAVRVILGCSRARLLRQVLTESLCLSLAGGLGGVALAYAALRATVRLRTVELPQLGAVGLDARVLAFAGVVTLLAAALAGLVPALRAWSPRAHEDIKEGARGALGPGRERAGQALLVGEIALSIVLLTGAALLVTSLARLNAVDPGFETDGLTVFQARLRGARYAHAADLDGFATRVAAELRAAPGVEEAAMCACLPLGGSPRLPLHSVDGRPKPPDRYLDSVHWMAATPSFFRTLRVPLRSGRAFTDADARGGAPVAIVNETFARKHFPDRSAVGRRLLLGWDLLGEAYEEDWREIVGVVADVRESRLQAAAKPSVFVPLAQIGDRALDVTSRLPASFFVRTKGGGPLGRSGAETAVRAADPLVAVGPLRGMRDVVRESLQQRVLETGLLGGFAAAALALVVGGVFGLVSHMVAQRTQEIGVRVAVGARPGDVTRLVLARTLRMSALGLALGLPATLALGRLLEGSLFGVAPHDPAVVAASVLLLAAVALAAGYLPARRAARTDVVAALRSR